MRWRTSANGTRLQNPFDVVICVDAIACIREQSLVMAGKAGRLRSGGRLVMTTVNRFVYDPTPSFLVRQTPRFRIG